MRSSSSRSSLSTAKWYATLMVISTAGNVRVTTSDILTVETAADVNAASSLIRNINCLVPYDPTALKPPIVVDPEAGTQLASTLNCQSYAHEEIYTIHNARLRKIVFGLPVDGMIDKLSWLDRAPAYIGDLEAIDTDFYEFDKLLEYADSQAWSEDYRMFLHLLILESFTCDESLRVAHARVKGDTSVSDSLLNTCRDILDQSKFEYWYRLYSPKRYVKYSGGRIRRSLVSKMQSAKKISEDYLWELWKQVLQGRIKSVTNVLERSTKERAEDSAMFKEHVYSNLLEEKSLRKLWLLICGFLTPAERIVLNHIKAPTVFHECALLLFTHFDNYARNLWDSGLGEAWAIGAQYYKFRCNPHNTPSARPLFNLQSNSMHSKHEELKAYLMKKIHQLKSPLSAVNANVGADPFSRQSFASFSKPNASSGIQLEPLQLRAIDRISENMELDDSTRDYFVDQEPSQPYDTFQAIIYDLYDAISDGVSLNYIDQVCKVDGSAPQTLLKVKDLLPTANERKERLMSIFSKALQLGSAFPDSNVRLRPTDDSSPTFAQFWQDFKKLNDSEPLKAPLSFPQVKELLGPFLMKYAPYLF